MERRAWEPLCWLGCRGRGAGAGRQREGARRLLKQARGPEQAKAGRRPVSVWACSRDRGGGWRPGGHLQGLGRPWGPPPRAGRGAGGPPAENRKPTLPCGLRWCWLFAGGLLGVGNRPTPIHRAWESLAGDLQSKCPNCRGARRRPPPGRPPRWEEPGLLLLLQAENPAAGQNLLSGEQATRVGEASSPERCLVCHPHAHSGCTCV